MNTRKDLKRKKHTFEDRLKYMHMIEDGHSIHSIHCKYGINENVLHVLLSKYQSSDPSALCRARNFKANSELKRKILLDIEENHLTLSAASLKYGPSPKTIEKWLHVVRRDGYAVLDIVKKRGRAKGMGRPRKYSSPLTGETPKREPGAEDGDSAAKKSESLSRGKECPTTRDWARAIEGLRHEGHPLDFMLRRMKMARSVFYYHRVRLDEPDGYEGLMDKITEAYEKSHRRYGYRRVCYALKDDGVNVNHKTVLKLMQQMGLKAKCKKRHYHSYKGDVGKIAPNVIGRDFAADKPNMKWATDVTQVCINDVKTYISPILDMFNGEIISYTISRSPNLKMVTDMLKQAFRKRPHLAGLIMHSDQGWHYQHGLYQKLLGSRGIIQSMSRKGNCLDNSMMENFFAIMKNEMLYTAKYDSVEDFEQELRKYIWWYNNKRIKLRLKGMSPVQYRAHNREL